MKTAEEIFDDAYDHWSKVDNHQNIKEAMIAAMEEYKNQSQPIEKPFLGWTNDKDILNQQREYWGAMNGMTELRNQLKEQEQEIERLKENLEYANLAFQTLDREYKKIEAQLSTIERLEKEKEELKARADRVSNLENRLLSANSDIQSRNKKIEKLNDEIQRFNPNKLYEAFRDEFKHSDYSRMTPLDFVEWLEDRLPPDN